MKEKIIDFYVFSGTGNTYTIVKAMEEEFLQNGYKVHIKPLEKTNPKDIHLNHIIGLAFPVAEQGTYPFIWHFIQSLPHTQNTPIFMIDTLMGYSGGIIGPVRKIVTKKGYRPIGAKEIRMPNNLFPKKIKGKNKLNLIKKGKKQGKIFAKKIIQQKAVWIRIPFGSDIMALFSQSQLTWRFIRNYYDLRINKQKCNQCRLCLKICPIKCITFDNYPTIDTSCVLCMRCISYCPKKAIQRKGKSFQQYQAVSLKELMQSLIIKDK